MHTLLVRLWRHVSKQRRVQLGILLCVMLAGSFAELFSIGMVAPFLGVLTAPELTYNHHLVKPFVMFFGFTGPQELLLPTTVVFSIAVIVANFIRLLAIWLQTRIGMGIMTEMAVETYWRTLHQPYPVQISRNSSEVISGIVTKIGSGIGASILPFLYVVSSVLTMAAILGGLVLFDPLVALLCFGCFGTVYSIFILFAKKRLAGDSLRISAASNRVMKVLQEGLGGIRDILIDGTQSIHAAAYRSADLELRRAQASIQIISSAPKFLIEAIGIVAIAVVAYSLSNRPGGLITFIPLLGALAVGAQKLLPIFQQTYSSWALIRGAREPLRAVLDLLDQPLPGERPGYTTPTKISFAREIRLDRVAFRYTPQAPYVLSNICLKFPKGSRVGFIGTTGSGKSTLLDILMGLLEPTEGNIMIDGVTLDPSNRRSWQAHIAHVPQAIFLSDATIAENIAFGLPRDEIDFERVKIAARQAQISEVVESWSEQYDTLVGERGLRLSGGQRQRIGIARALYKQADVLVLDEATSSLDNDTEHAVIQAVNGLGDHMTVLIIAHRLSTLRGCSQIVEIQNGSLERVGTYAEIIQ